MQKFTPIAELGGALQEQGRIRLGVKDAKRGMKSIDTFRFTSPDRGVIDKLAEVYGGVAKPWNDPKANVKKQFEVITTTNEISVWVGSEGISQWYEYWSGGGCQRRCDGQVCNVPDRETVWRETVCICNSEQPPAHKDICKPKTRMTVIIPEVRMAGGWRIETSSWNAAKEMPMMEQLVRSMQSNGLMAAKLRITHGMSQTGKQTKRYTYPQLILDETPAAIMSGQADVARLTRADVEQTPALQPGEVVTPVSIMEEIPPAHDYLGEDITDAEIIEEGWDTKDEAIAAGRPFKLNRGGSPKYVPTD